MQMEQQQLLQLLLLLCCVVVFELLLISHWMQLHCQKKEFTIFLGSANAIVTLFSKLNKIQRSHMKLGAFTWIF